MHSVYLYTHTLLPIQIRKCRSRTTNYCNSKGQTQGGMELSLTSSAKEFFHARSGMKEMTKMQYCSRDSVTEGHNGKARKRVLERGPEMKKYPND